MSTIMLCLLLLIMTACSIKLYIRRMSEGCCGGSGQPYVSKVKVADHNRSHYPYHRILKVDGMSCGNSAVHVENALNSIEGVWAKVNLLKEEVSLYMKQDIDEGVFCFAVKDAGYTVCKNQGNKGQSKKD